MRNEREEGVPSNYRREVCYCSHYLVEALHNLLYLANLWVLF